MSVYTEFFYPLGLGGVNLEVLLNSIYFVTEYKFMEVSTDFLQNNVKTKLSLTKNLRQSLTYTKNVPTTLGHCDTQHRHTHTHNLLQEVIQH